MSNISQFLGGAPKNIIRGTTVVQTIGGRSSTIRTGIFMNSKSYIVQSCRGRLQIGGGYGYVGNASARRDSTGELIVTIEEGYPGGSRFSWTGNMYAVVDWQIIEY